VSKEGFDFILDVTHFKSKNPWNANPMEQVTTKAKSALTR
jgi:hypothetical protein